MKKRIFAVLLALCLALALVPTAALAADDFTISGGTLTSYRGPGGIVNIPQGVTTIGKRAFENEHQVVLLNFPDSLTVIGDYAFQYCGSLVKLEFPSSLTTIGEAAFGGCNALAGVIISANISSLGAGVFRECSSLSSLTVEGSRGSLAIPSGAFRSCKGLATVLLSDRVTTLGKQCFSYCVGLQSITIPKNVQVISEEAFNGCSGLTSVTILSPNAIISKNAFNGTSLLDVYYSGTEAQWNAMMLDTEGNDKLTGATIHYNSTGPNDTPDPTPGADPDPSTDPEPTPAVKVTGVTLSRSSLIMEPGQAETLTVTVSPTDAPDKSITWASSKNAVARVNGNGLVTAVAAGTADITATTTDGSYTATCRVTVKADGVKVTGVTVSRTSLTMEPGQAETLTATVSPTAAANSAVTWSSNNPAVASVTSGGRVTALAAGAAEITAKTDDGGFTAVCRVLVKGEDKPAPVEVHFPRANVYNQGQFTDVPADQWYTDSVKQAFEMGLMKGTSDTVFEPQGNVTVAQAITMAARLHSIYTTGGENFVQGGVWYQVYLDYAFQNGIISYAFYNSDVTKNATRAQFAEIFANALPDEALSPISTVPDGKLPDVPMSAPYASHVYKLYRAGVLTGSDVTGTFSPDTYITRQESAALVSRMAESSSRKSFTLG